MNYPKEHFVVIVPAAGVGKRMLAPCPKQYLKINGETILSHTINRLLNHEKIAKVIIALSADDGYFAETALANHPDITIVTGGKERVDSVLNGLQIVDPQLFPWVLVHDAARPCVRHEDIDELIAQCLSADIGGMLTAPVVDTMKQSHMVAGKRQVLKTLERSQVWHGLTPQMYKTEQLKQAIEQANQQGVLVTDESSAIEQAGLPSLLISSSRENIKITQPEDLALATFYLNQQKMKKERTTCA